MAKTQKYSEDQLLDAVVKFSEIEKKKIKATELAKWCRDNVEGLEEVRDYHFTRSVKERNEKTGKMVNRPKLCTLKIEELNKSRSLTVSINKNLLLRASNIDTFMEQTDSAKRKMIVETRETVDKLLVRNGNISRENEALKSENEALKSDLLKITERMEALQKVQSKLNKQVTYLMKVTDEALRKEMLSQMGIEDEMVDLDAYTEGLKLELSEIMNINTSLQKHLSGEGELPVEEARNVEDEKISLFDEVMSGLDF